MRRLAVLAAMLLAACATPAIHVNHERGIDGAWSVGDRSGVTTADVTGDRLTIGFAGRTFVFDGIGKFSGTLHPDGVRLIAEDMRIGITPARLEVVEGGRRLARDLDELPADRRIVYAGGFLLFE